MRLNTMSLAKNVLNKFDFINHLESSKDESSEVLEVDFTIELKTESDKNEVLNLLKRSYDVASLNKLVVGVILRVTQDFEESFYEIKELLRSKRIKVIEFAG